MGDLQVPRHKWDGANTLKQVEPECSMTAVSLTKFSDEECEDMYPTNRLLKSGLDSSAQMCYGHKTIIRDTCKGDSGGPLQLDTGHPTCMHTIIGVTSYGRECGFQGADC
ncbi:Serine protease HP21 [Operophtera brumata]|uniref:Serine protease HP21 n=1 Tax=Operophtera brumata TaxID=104452 RepID=A0A0L7KYR5_OPEBR|nr:Serine protease HP21 [Operophtera brumata]